MEEAEVKVKASLDDVQLRAGAASAKQALHSFAEESEHKMHKLHSALRVVKMALHGFGIGAVLATGLELAEKWDEFWKPYIMGTHEAEEATKRVVAAQQEIGKANKEISKSQADAAKEARELMMDNMNPVEKKDFLESELQAINKQMDLAGASIKKIKDDQKQDWKGNLIPLDIEDAKRLAKLEVEYGKLNEQQIAHMRELGKDQKEIDKDKADAEKELYEKQLRAIAERKKLELELANAVIAARTKEQHELSPFAPSDKEIRDSGYTDKRGRFHPSEASQMQKDIDEESAAFKDNMLNGVFNGDAAGALKEANYIKGMKDNLNEYLGKPQDISQAQLDALKTGVDIQTKILGVFTGTVDTK
jgi:hypothetical protein